MREGRVNTESWHYWFYNQSLVGSSSDKPLNICNYPYLVILGMLWVACLSMVGFAVGLFLLEPYAVGIMTLITGHFIPGFFLTDPDVFEISVFIQVCIVLLVGGTYCKEHWERWRSNVRYRNRLKKREKAPSPKPSGFTKLCIDSYRAFKDKTCMKLIRYTPGEKE